MALHFLHIGKTGGTVVKQALRRARVTESRYGTIYTHKHKYRMRDVPKGDAVFFCLRDPVKRFISSFDSRYRKGQPRYFYEWTDAERKTFERFGSPNQLGHAIAQGDPSAARALRTIRHVRAPLRHWLGSPAMLKKQNIVYIMRQESLDVEWPHVCRAIGIPEDLELPRDPVRSHRGSYDPDQLDEVATAALRGLFADDYLIIDFCERLRAANGWNKTSSPDPLAADISTG